MAEFSVFYSWQSDLPRRTTRDVIHGAAMDAVHRLAADGELVDSPRLDHDTLDVAGAPEIARTIFEKIDLAAMFIADVTFIGKSEQPDPNKKAKFLPNPNVLIELGYAAHQLGSERLICVFNSAYGEPENLPFDLVHRRFPLTFKIRQGADNIAEKQAELSASIEEAIKASTTAEYLAAQRCIERLDLAAVQVCLEHGRKAYFSPRPYGNLNDRLARMDERDAIARLLDLRMIRADYNLAASRYAYHWTYLGKKAIDQMGVPALEQAIAPVPDLVDFQPIDAMLEGHDVEPIQEIAIAAFDERAPQGTDPAI